jgi:hypothetical protein
LKPLDSFVDAVCVARSAMITGFTAILERAELNYCKFGD